MIQKIFQGNFAAISFLFFGSLLSGVVLLGTSQAFSFMLTERGVSVSLITRILIATIPYSWKFVISPFVKNLILKSKAQTYVIKILAFAMQSIIFVGFSSLGLFEKSGSLVLAGVIVFIIVIAISVHDILKAHITLNYFENKNFGIVTSIDNAGFRIGMFISGACILYIANAIGWKVSYFIVSLSALIVSVPTFLMPKLQAIKHTIDQKMTCSIMDYLKICFKFFQEHGIFLLVFVFISFKFSDGCINCLKGVFLHSLGIGKLFFANMSQLIGMFSMIIGGTVAGCVIHKIGIKMCIGLSLITQCIAPVIFIFLSLFKVDMISLTLLINTATFIFGFLNVVFRTFVAEKSNGDINIYMVLLSVGSVIRVLSYSLGGEIVDLFSWTAVYVTCLISCLPGILLYPRLFILK